MTWLGILSRRMLRGTLLLTGCLVFLATPHISKAYTVPPGVTSVYIQAWGAAGTMYGGPAYLGNCNGNNGTWWHENNAAGVGGYAAGWATVSPGDILTVVNGSYGGGGSGYGNGGGYSGVFINGAVSQANALVVAGGGGGSGAYYLSSGGCSTNQVGPNGQPGGGANGAAGAPFTGGNGPYGYMGGGGGSGYNGGSGGAFHTYYGDGGGGGSGYCAPSITGCVNSTGAGSGGNGSVTITAGYPMLTLTASPATVEYDTPTVLTYSATGGSGFSQCYILGGRFGNVMNGSNTNGQLYNAFGTSGTVNSGLLTGGGTHFFDASSFVHSINPAGNIAITGATSKFGGASGAFDGASSFSSNDSAQYRLTGDYTIDLWVRPASVSSVSGGIVSKANGSGYAPFLVYQSNGTYLFYSSSNGSIWDIALAKSLGTATLNTWTHLAVVRSGNTYYAFNNGVQTDTWNSASAPMQTTDALLVGKQYPGGAFYNGYIDELRISNTARWTAGFTPPTSAYTSDASTMFLVHADAVATAGWFQYECFSSADSTWYVVNLAVPYTTASFSFTPDKWVATLGQTVTFSSSVQGMHNNGNIGTTLPNSCTISRTGP